MATATTAAPARTFLINKKSGGNFTPMGEGLHQAVVAEVKDLGIISGQFGEQHKFVARFVNAEGEEASRFYTPSIHEKSSLYKDWNPIVGLGEEFDIYSLEGQQVQVFVTAGEKDGRPTAKVEKVLKPAKGQNVVAKKNAAPAAAPAKKAPVAAKAALKAKATTKQAEEAAEGEITDDDIPF